LGVGRGFGLCDERGALGVGSKHGVDQAAAIARRLLGDGADPGARQHRDGAAVWGQLAADQPEERGLAAAVAPHHPDPGTRRNLRRGAPEQGLAGNREGEVTQAQHGAAG